MNKYLIIRFSSFGDICQALPAAYKIRELDPHAEIHWLTRQDFSDLTRSATVIDRHWALDKKQGFAGLAKLVKNLKQENFTHVYDAHANLRSFFVLVNLWLHNWQIKWVRRPKNRILRLLLFYCRLNFLPKPFRGTHSFLWPLRTWFSDITLPSPLKLNIPAELPKNVGDVSQAIVLAPSANWELKRWPEDYWVQLIKKNPDKKFLILGGPQDLFCNTIAQQGGAHAKSLVGQVSWAQSMQIIAQCQMLVSGDTGLLHYADVLGVKTIALIGPTAFGYPSRASSHVLEVELPCKPCTKDGNTRCRNTVHKRCLREITPETVSHTLNQYL